MLYVFLDIGGVLNRKDGFYDEDDFSFFCMRQFGNAIKDFPNVRIVLISQWRDRFVKNDECEYPLNILKRHVERWGPEFYDVTQKDILENRYLEIQNYIKEHNVEDYVIVDDESRYYPKGCENLFLVKSDDGFTKEDKDALFQMCVRILYGSLQKEVLLEEEITLPSDEEYLRMKKEWDPDYINCTIRVTEAYKETGQLWMEAFNAKAVFLPGLMYKRPNYNGEKIDGTNVGVYSDEVLDFIKGLENEVKNSFPISNILDMLWFDTEDDRAKELLADAQEKYLGEYGI